jgi:3-oxoacyl-[acyl-carrier-protein] synthase-3
MSGLGACISGVAYALPAASRSVIELARAGQLQSDPAVLTQFGFGTVRVAIEESPYALALRAARTLLEERAVEPDSIDVLIWGGAPWTIALAPAGDRVNGSALHTTERFKYPATRMQYELGLGRAQVFGIDQLACTTLFTAARLARALIASNEARRVLCVSAEFFPGDAGREAIFNCTSDAACALLIDRRGQRNRLAGSAQVTKGYYWDCDTLRNEIVASYFPTAVHVVAQALANAEWRPDEVDWVIPHNVSLRSWELLLRLTRLPRARLWSANIARLGHTLAGDNFINLRDALDAGDVHPGEKLLLFSYGYGAHWTALAVEA